MSRGLVVQITLIAPVALAACGRLGFEARPDGVDATTSEVRHGTCVLAAGASLVACPIAPPQHDVTRTALWFQATGDGIVPGDFDVRCQLTGMDTIACDRQSTTGTSTIAWQTLERTAGITVQHVPFSCSMQTTFTQPIDPVDAARAFVLGSWTQAGSFLNDDDFLTLELSASAVVVRTGSVDSCGIDAVGPMEGALEVVELEGITVTRGIAGPMVANDVALSVTGLPAVDVASTALLVSYRSVSDNVPVCRLMVRGELTSPTELAFSRGMGDLACGGAEVEAVVWERIELGALAKVQAFTIELAPGATSALAPITGVDLSRAIVLSTAQGVNGQGTGEGNAPTAMTGGELTATMTIEGEAVRVERSSAEGSARFSGQVIEWQL